MQTTAWTAPKATCVQGDADGASIPGDMAESMRRLVPELLLSKLFFLAAMVCLPRQRPAMWAATRLPKPLQLQPSASTRHTLCVLFIDPALHIAPDVFNWAEVWTSGRRLNEGIAWEVIGVHPFACTLD